jgi:hypothetical protein
LGDEWRLAALKETAMFTKSDVEMAIAVIGLDMSEEQFQVEDLARGMEVELEHGTRFPELDVTGDDPVLTAKIAVAHLREFPDYYDRLEVMERRAEAAWSMFRDPAHGIVWERW